jgi:hypothetical protein
MKNSDRYLLHLIWLLHGSVPLECGCFYTAECGDDPHAFGLMGPALQSTCVSIGHLEGLSVRCYSTICCITYSLQLFVYIVDC